MTKKTNPSPTFAKVRQMYCLKTAVAATVLLWCTQPMNVVADNMNETHKIATTQQQNVRTTGTVVDESGGSLIGVSVKVQGTVTGTITDLNGQFTVNSPKGSTLILSFIGYKTIKIKAEGTPLTITMKEDSEQLDEVVVIGYGTQKKVNVTGAVGMIDSKALTARPVTNVAQALKQFRF